MRHPYYDKNHLLQACNSRAWATKRLSSLSVSPIIILLRMLLEDKILFMAGCVAEATV